MTQVIAFSPCTAYNGCCCAAGYSERAEVVIGIANCFDEQVIWWRDGGYDGHVLCTACRDIKLCNLQSEESCSISRWL